MPSYRFPQLVQPCQLSWRAFSDVAIPKHMLIVPQSHVFKCGEMWNQFNGCFGLKMVFSRTCAALQQIASHLLGLNCSPHLWDHLVTKSSAFSSCGCMMPSLKHPSIHKMRSSIYACSLTSINCRRSWRRSLRYIQKRVHDNVDLCGTPQSSCTSSRAIPSSRLPCLLRKKDLIHQFKYSSIPMFFILVSNPACHTVSYGCWISSARACTWCRVCSASNTSCVRSQPASAASLPFRKPNWNGDNKCGDSTCRTNLTLTVYSSVFSKIDKMPMGLSKNLHNKRNKDNSTQTKIPRYLAPTICPKGIASISHNVQMHHEFCYSPWRFPCGNGVVDEVTSDGLTRVHYIYSDCNFHKQGDQYGPLGPSHETNDASRIFNNIGRHYLPFIWPTKSDHSDKDTRFTSNF